MSFFSFHTGKTPFAKDFDRNTVWPEYAVKTPWDILYALKTILVETYTNSNSHEAHDLLPTFCSDYYGQCDHTSNCFHSFDLPARFYLQEESLPTKEVLPFNRIWSNFD